MLETILRHLLNALAWLGLGYYKARAKTSEAALKSIKKANDVKDSINRNVNGARDRIRGLYSRK